MDSAEQGLGRTAEAPSDTLLFGLCCLLLVLPLWTVQYLPMVDLPQHAAQISVMKHLNDPAFGYRDIFTLKLFTPYLLGYGLGWLLSALVSVQTALRILITVAVLAVPLTARTLNIRMGGRPEWSFLAFPIALSFSYGWGFLNFLIGIPLSLIFIVLSCRYAEQPTRVRGAWLFVLSLILFWCHLVIAAFSCLVGATIVGLRSTGLKSALTKVLPFASPVPLAFLWLLRTSATEAQVNTGIVFGGHLERIALLPSHVLGSIADTFQASGGLTYFLAGSILLCLPFLTGAGPSRKIWRWAPLVICLALYFASPSRAFFTFQLYPRFAVFVVPLLLLALEPRVQSFARDSITRKLPLVFALGWMLSTLLSYQSFAKETGDFDRVLDQMEPHKKVLGMVFEQQSEYRIGPVYVHFPCWYQVNRGGVSQVSFAKFFSVVARFKPGADARVKIGFEWVPQIFEWERHGGEEFDYFLVRSESDVSPLVFQDDPVALKFRSDQWWVFENLDRPE